MKLARRRRYSSRSIPTTPLGVRIVGGVPDGCGLMGRGGDPNGFEAAALVEADLPWDTRRLVDGWARCLSLSDFLDLSLSTSDARASAGRNESLHDWSHVN